MQNKEVIDVEDCLLPSFHDLLYARDEDYTHYVCKGGRSSAKSTSVAECLILDMVEYPISGLVVRRVYNTLEKSCFEQLKEAVSILHLEGQFSFRTNPLTITYTPRGNQIVFRGGDDVSKIKSIKIAGFPIARLWFEEVSEFKTEQELQVVVDSVVRAKLPDGLQYKIYYSYNPPNRLQHWLNKKYNSVIVPPKTFIHSSTYLDNSFLSEQALEEIENYKATKGEAKYAWYYLGDVRGGGVVPFDNLNFRTITSEEISHFDNYRQGLDFGYAVDPVSFVRLHYDKTRRIIYFTDEIFGVKMSNRELFAKLKDEWKLTKAIADSAEPKSIAELKSLGMKITGAVKGEGSVEYGEKWLDDLNEIIIDPARTPNIAREFENIDYQVDRDGNTLAKLEDKDNHSIDASRYALELDMGKPLIGLLR